MAPALVVVDVQRDVLDDGSLPVPGTSAVVPRVAELCRAFRSAGAPIVHVVRLYSADGGDAEPFRRDLVRSRPVLRPGTPGRLLAPGVVPGEPELDDGLLLGGGLQVLGPAEVAMYKPRWGAFHRTPLEEHLRSLGVGAVVVAGANLPNCPRATAVEASERDLEVVVVADATSGFDDRAGRELAGMGIAVRSTAEVVADLADLGARSPRPAPTEAARVHRYRATCAWEGSTGVGYDAYVRDHVVDSPDGGPARVVSGDPAFGGSPGTANPELLLLQAAASCQLLSFLAVAARARIDVVAYRDEAEAVMPEGPRPWWVTAITLRPRITVRGRVDEARVQRLVQVAHRECFIAGSLRTAITVEAVVDQVG